MKLLRTFIFKFLGIIAIINMTIGPLIWLTLIGMITHKWLTVIIIAVVYVCLDVWRHFYYTSHGYKSTIGGYNKE